MDFRIRFPFGTGEFYRGVVFVLAAIVGLCPTAWAQSSYTEVTLDALAPSEAGSSGLYSVATQPATGYPAIAVAGAYGFSVVLMEYDGSKWNFERVAFPDSIIVGISLAYNPVTHEPWIAYSCGYSINGNGISIDFTGLKVAHRSGTSWQVETVATTHPARVDLLIPPSGSPVQLVYEDWIERTDSGYTIRYAQRTGPDAYSIEILEEGSDSAAAIDPQTSHVAIVYGSSSTHGWRLAERGDSGWTYEDVSMSDGGRAVSLTYANRGGTMVPNLVLDQSNKVYYEEGGTWHSETPVPSADVIQDLRTDPSTGAPVVAWTQVIDPAFTPGLPGTSLLGVSRLEGMTWTSSTLELSYYNQATRFSDLPSRRLTLSPDGNPTVVLQGWEYIPVVVRKTGGGFAVERPLSYRHLSTEPVSVARGADGRGVWAGYHVDGQQDVTVVHADRGGITRETVDMHIPVLGPVSLVMPPGADRPWVVCESTTVTLLALPDEGGYHTETVAEGHGISKVALDPLTGDLLIARVRGGEGLTFFRRSAAAGTWSSELVEAYHAGGGPPLFSLQNNYPHSLAVNSRTGEPHIQYTTDIDMAHSARYEAGQWKITEFWTDMRPVSLGVDPLTGWPVAIRELLGTYLLSARPFDGYSWGTWSAIKFALADENYPADPLTFFPLHDPAKDRLGVVLLATFNGINEVREVVKTESGWDDQIVSASLPPLEYFGFTFGPTGRTAFAGFDPWRERIVGYFDFAPAAVSGHWSLYR